MRFDVVLALYQRCSFRLVGQCEGLSIVERAAGLAPRFYLYKSTTTLLINAYNGALVQRLNKHEKKSEKQMATIAVFSNGSVWSNCM